MPITTSLCVSVYIVAVLFLKNFQIHRVPLEVSITLIAIIFKNFKHVIKILSVLLCLLICTVILFD